MRGANPAFDHRMPRTLHVSLCFCLQFACRNPDDCDHTLRLSSVILTELGSTNVAGALQWLREHGLNCDCEVIMNTMPWRDSKIASK